MDAKINEDYVTFTLISKLKLSNWINALKACGDSTVMKNPIEIFKGYGWVDDIIYLYNIFLIIFILLHESSDDILLIIILSIKYDKEYYFRKLSFFYSLLFCNAISAESIY